MDVRWLVLAGLVACGPTLEETEAELCALVEEDVAANLADWIDLYRGQTADPDTMRVDACDGRVSASGDTARADVELIGESPGLTVRYFADCTFVRFDVWELDGCDDTGIEVPTAAE